MAKSNTRKPKRRTRTGRTGGFSALQFVRASSSAVPAGQSAVLRVGNAIIGGDFTGNARGENALDIQVQRDEPSEVASGARSIAFGRASVASGDDSAALGANTFALSTNAVAMGAGAYAEGIDAVAIGSGLIVLSDGAIGIGAQVNALAENALALGYGAIVDSARGVAIGYSAYSDAADKAVIAGTHLFLQTDDSPLTQVEVLTEANYTSFIDLSDYVEVSGDTMTGALTINFDAGATPFMTLSSPDTNPDAVEIWVKSAFSALANSDDFLGKIVFQANNSTASRMAIHMTDQSGNLIKGLQLEDLAGGVFLRLPTTGPSGIGADPFGGTWLGYCSQTNDWFVASAAGDIAYRNANGSLLFGLSASQQAHLKLTTSGFIYNDEGLSALDVRIEGDTDANLVFVDSSADKVGIGTNAPGYKLDVSGDVNAASAVYRVSGTQVVSARNTGWTAPTATQSKAGFGNGATATQIEQTLSAVVNALMTHGLLGA